MNKQSKKVLLGAATVAAMLGAASHKAVAATTADIVINAEIIAAIDITAINTLNFGTISLTGAGPYDVTVPANGAPSSNGSLSLIGGQAAGSFRITGVPGIAFDVTAPATATVSNGATQLDVTSFVFGAANQAGSLNATLAGVTATYGIGGTLDIPVNTQPGSYAGTVTLTATYN